MSIFQSKILGSLPKSSTFHWKRKNSSLMKISSDILRTPNKMRSQGLPTDQRAGERHKRLVNLWSSLISDTQLAKLMQPRDRSLDHPAIHPKAAAMFRVSLRQHWLNSSLPQLQTVRLRIIGPVTLHPFGPLPGSATLAFDRRNGLDQRQQLRHVCR